MERKGLLFVPKRVSDIEGEGDFYSFLADGIELNVLHKDTMTVCSCRSWD